MPTSKNSCRERWMAIVCGVSLVAFALAKLDLLRSGDRILDQSDPLLGIKFVWLVGAAAVAEMTTGVLLLNSAARRLGWHLLLLFASNLLIYRLALATLGPLGQPCPCMGSMGSWFPGIVQHQAVILNAVAVAWLAGSLAGLRLIKSLHA